MRSTAFEWLAVWAIALGACAVGSARGGFIPSPQPERVESAKPPAVATAPADVLDRFEAWSAPWLTPLVEEWFAWGVSTPERLLTPNGGAHRSVSDAQLDLFLREIAPTAERYPDLAECTRLLRASDGEEAAAASANRPAATLAAVAALWPTDRHGAAEIAAAALLSTPDRSQYPIEVLALAEVVAAAPEAVVAPAVLARLSATGVVTQAGAYLLATNLDLADAGLLESEVVKDEGWEDAHPGARCSAAYVLVEYADLCGEDPDVLVVDALALGIGQGPMESLRAACHADVAADERRALIKDAVTNVVNPFDQHAALLKQAIDRHYSVVAGLFRDPEFVASLTREQRSFVRQIVRLYELDSRPAPEK